MSRPPGHVSRKPRVSVEHDATLVMSDVSSGGFHLKTNETVPIGEHVFLRVARYGDFPAQIRWSLGLEAGGVFLKPVELP